MTDRVLYCVGPDSDGNLGKCPEPVAGHGEDACSTHRRQLSRTGKMVPIAKKVSAKEHLINLFERIAEADSDEDYEAANRAFDGALKAMKPQLTPDDVTELVKKALSERTRRGMAAAKAKGKHIGRPRRVDQQEVQRLLALDRLTLVALMLGASKSTIYAALQKGTLSGKTPHVAKRAAAKRPRSHRASSACR